MVGKAIGKKLMEKRTGMVVRCAARSVDESTVQVKDEEESLWGL